LEVGEEMMENQPPFSSSPKLNESRGAELASTLTPVEYPITFYHKKEEFTVPYPRTDFVKSHNIMKDKIVLVGYLGPTDEDLYSTPVMMKPRQKNLWCRDNCQHYSGYS
jgi:hypothetical protein